MWLARPFEDSVITFSMSQVEDIPAAQGMYSNIQTVVESPDSFVVWVFVSVSGLARPLDRPGLNEVSTRTVLPS